jgi:quercetin dioxygenase-like cupin family protein
MKPLLSDRAARRLVRRAGTISFSFWPFCSDVGQTTFPIRNVRFWGGVRTFLAQAEDAMDAPMWSFGTDFGRLPLSLMLRLPTAQVTYQRCQELAATLFGGPAQATETMAQTLDVPLADLKLQIDGLVPPDKLFHRRELFDGLYASFPKDPEAKVQIYAAEIVPKGWTNFHCHNGATFFIALQGVFEAHFEDGILIRAKAGDVYSEPIGKMHRGHNPHDVIPYLCVAFCVTAPDRDHVTNVVQAF